MNKLEEYREQMSALDEDFVQLFLERMRLSQKIGAYKKEKQLPIFQEEREKYVIQKMVEKGNTVTEKIWIETFFHFLMDFSKEVQK